MTSASLRIERSEFPGRTDIVQFVSTRTTPTVVNRQISHVIRILAISVALCTSASAAVVPERVEIVYRVSVGSLHVGEGHDLLQHDGKTYNLVSESKTVGLAALLYRLSVVRRSSGRITATGLRPESFAELRNGKPKRSARFDWNKGTAVLIDDKKEQTVPLPEHTWDQASFAYNFAFAGLDNAAFSVNLTDGRRIQQYDYEVVGKETLDTQIGKLETIHVKKVQPPGDKRGFDAWISLAHQNLPVRIRVIEKDGTAFDSVVAKIAYPGKEGEKEGKKD
jgi:hypothetical protein